MCANKKAYKSTGTLIVRILYITIMLATASAWKNSVNATIEGIGMLIRPRALKSQNSIEKIQLRMMVDTFNGKLSATIISCYSPTNGSKETDFITFYNE